MTTIHGRNWSNRGRPAGIGASATLPHQLPLIAAEFPEIKSAFPGTINLKLDQPLVVAGYDHRTQPLRWEGGAGRPETFDLVRIIFEIPGDRFAGWLYVAHGSPHRADLRSHEIILRDKIGIIDGESCYLHIHRKCVTLPYGAQPLVVIA